MALASFWTASWYSFLSTSSSFSFCSFRFYLSESSSFFLACSLSSCSFNFCNLLLVLSCSSFIFFSFLRFSEHYMMSDSSCLILSSNSIFCCLSSSFLVFFRSSSYFVFYLFCFSFFSELYIYWISMLRLSIFFFSSSLVFCKCIIYSREEPSWFLSEVSLDKDSS